MHGRDKVNYRPLLVPIYLCFGGARDRFVNGTANSKFLLLLLLLLLFLLRLLQGQALMSGQVKLFSALHMVDNVQGK
jgi:hypothetical protein